ncbi:hypothetical protein BOQ07_26995 [Klebsiella michiganensis]|nr:hypothetical protein AB185_14285 [Klebsiella oxytoca]KMK46371.1 hypothetical protein ABW14_00055 [Klebsiella michiganensis]OFU90187.1 hypothetical protein HMPREF3111_03015 [Proteus sp. HMSC10D02]OEG82854.1 hypothetical protein AN700_0225150 [Klebsiella michiganensis]OLU15619.1 hypothetical protein BOQ07_26995 [Klebsiella michiganensis]
MLKKYRALEDRIIAASEYKSRSPKRLSEHFQTVRRQQQRYPRVIVLKSKRDGEEQSLRFRQIVIAWGMQIAETRAKNSIVEENRH